MTFRPISKRAGHVPLYWNSKHATVHVTALDYAKSVVYAHIRTRRWKSRGSTTFSKLGVQFRPWSRLLYRTKCGWYTQFCALQSVIRNGNHTLHQKSWGWSVHIWGVRPPDHRVVAPLWKSSL